MQLVKNRPLVSVQPDSDGSQPLGGMFNEALIERYNQNGPRYTSYPTALSFQTSFSEQAFRAAAMRGNEDPIPKPLSLYFHIPFCDTLCFYCACNKIATKDHSKVDVYLHSLFKEIEMQASLFDRDRIVEQLHWGGGTPTFLSIVEMRTLMAKTRESFSLLDDDSGEYSIEIDPRSVTRESIFELRALGFNRFSLGIQDVDPLVQKAINRIQPASMNAEITQACRDAGARSINFDLIYGLPFQSKDRFDRTLDSVIDLSPDRISVFNYAHLPDRFKPQRRIDESALPNSEVKLEILGHTIERLTAEGYVFIGMDHFAKPDDELVKAQASGQLQRNFQGYTTHGDCDLIGMGVSSISKVGETYSQNEKTLEGYYKKIKAGQLPIDMGVELSRDDVIRRYIIQEFMCNFTINRLLIENMFNIEFSSYFNNELALLEPMVADGLVTLHEDRIDILVAGRLLVRNICMVFDARLREMKKTQRFSRVI